jgi:glycosyltransferase involved in cell wall biosynthesis
MSEKELLIMASDMWLDRPHGASIIKMLEIFSKLLHKDVRLFLFSWEEREERRGNLIIKGLKLPRNLKEGSGSFLFHQMIRSLDLFKSADLVIFDYPLLPSFILSKIIKRDIKGISLILSRPLRNNPLHPRSIMYRFFLFISRAFVDLYTGITPYEVNDIAKFVGKNKTVLLPSPLAPEFLNPPGGCDTILGKYFSINDIRLLTSDKNLLLYHGVLDERRGLRNILDSFGRASSPEDYLVILGKGEGLPLVKRYAEKYPNIRYMGSVPLEVIPCVMKHISAGIAWLPDEPRWRFQLPTKILELMASGKPFLASDLPGIRWAVGGCPLAFYTHDITPQALSSFIKALSDIKDDHGICLKRSKDFSAENVANMLYSYVKRLL